MRCTSLICGILWLMLATAASAQQADVLTGRVAGADGRPLAGVRVEAISAETEITRSGLTDGNGRYLILFPDGGGRYLLRFTFIGMADVVRPLVREAEEELLVLDIRMTPQAVALDPITVAARRPPPGDARAGEQSVTLSQDLLNRLPLPDLDPSTLAQLAAGVIGTGVDSITGLGGFSVAGMSELLNQVTLDGTILGQGGVGVPEEGLRQTSITTSTFDASRGGFAGGAVSMASARGTNRTGGGFSYRFDSDALQSTAAATTNAFSRQQLGGSFGGALTTNRLFYNGALQFSRNTQHRFALSATDPLAALRSGVAVDSIARFLGILDTRYDFATFDQTGPYNQQSDDVRLQGRMDWNILQQPTRSQTLSVRVNASMVAQDSTRISQLDLLQRGGDTERNNVLAAATLTSRFRNTWTNTVNLAFSEGWSEAVPFVELPEGRVRVTSDFEDGTRQTSQLAFGGNRGMPTEGRSRDLQLANDLSLLRPVRNQLHRFKLGGSIQYTRDVSRSTDNLFGTFTYASLQDFFDNRPERYERSVADRESRTGALMTGVYIGDTWRVSNPLEITMGLRWDRTALDQTPAHNPRVEELFGLRTDLAPVASTFSPRLGFNYRLNQQGQATRAVSGGIGVFAGRAPTGIFSTAVRQTGLPDADQRLTCIGDAVPVPDWRAYQQDPLAVPAACADGSSGQHSTRAPNVTIIGEQQSAPSSLRGELGYRTSLPLRMTGSFRYTWSRGLGLWGYRDLNIDETSYVTLSGEARPYFGDPDAIIERTGATSLASSRRFAEFGSVHEVVTDRQSEAHQLTASVNGWLPIRMMFNANYTLSFARDQGSSGMGGLGIGGGAIGGMGGGLGGGIGFSVPTAGSPNDVEWAPSGSDRRHTFNLMLSYPVTPWLEVSGLTRIAAGAPFTPMVNRDINGDGMRNDRAFIFDPARPETDPDVAAAMTRLLATSPQRVRSCLEQQLGRIADRNSCRDGWTQSLDLRGSFRPSLPTLQRRLTIHADIRNVLTGLDQLLHGRDDMRGWGEGQRSDPNLLEVRGFDRAQNRFVYEVNEGFGQSRRGPGAFRNAFSVTLSGRVAVGGNPAFTNRGFGQTPFGSFAGMEGFGGMGGGGVVMVGGGGGAMMGGAGMIGGGGGGGTMIVRGGADGPIVIGGAGGMGDIIRLFGDGNPGADSVLATIFVNPLPQILEARGALELTDDQLAAVRVMADSLEARHARRRPAVEPVIRQLSDAIGIGGRPNMQVMSGLREQLQLELLPNVQGARRETAEAVRELQSVLTPEQWERLETGVRQLEQADRAPSFNAVAVLDRLLANPLPVLLELSESVGLSAEQVARIREISARLEETLNRRREEIGRRFDNLPPDQVVFVFQQAQPDIERGRNDVRAALRDVERVLTRAQWNALPDRLRDPYQPAGGIRPPGGE
jgi:hypothetical protein